MKKILIMFLCAFLLLNMACVAALADEVLAITSGTVANGEQNACVSPLITFEFSDDINVVTADEITCLPASVSEVEVSGNKLSVRLSLPMEYNTEHTLDLSRVTSAGNAALAESEKTIKFKTKEGMAGKILEDDFETKSIDTAKWRAPASGSGAVQKEGDGGNWSYHIASGGTLDNYLYPLPYPLQIENKAILDFDIFIEDATADYNFFTLLGNNGLSGDEAKSFETYWTGLLSYDYENKTFGVLYNQEIYKGASGYPADANAAVTAIDGWNSLRVVVDLNERTLKLIVNGTEAVDAEGNADFKIPFSSQYGSAGQMLANVKIPSTASAKLYFDNISYRQLDAPVLTSSSVKNGDILSVTCPEIRMSFKNDITALSLKINGEDMQASNIVKNADGTYSAFPSLVWGESYSLVGVMEGLYGTESTFTINFTTAEQEGNLIETVGFFSGSERIYSLTSGDVTAKLKFWQDEPQTYLYVAAAYKNTDGFIEMVSPLSFGEFTSEGNLAEKDITVTVPSDIENCFMKVFVLKDSLTRVPYEQSLFSGSMVLE